MKLELWFENYAKANIITKLKLKYLIFVFYLFEIVELFAIKLIKYIQNFFVINPLRIYLNLFDNSIINIVIIIVDWQPNTFIYKYI